MPTEMPADELEEFERMEQQVYSMIEKKQLIEIAEPTKATACLVLYFDDNDKICHSARMTLESWPEVTSIWVNRHSYIPGKIMQHAIWHVPTGFGTKVKYFFPAPNLSEVWSK